MVWNMNLEEIIVEKVFKLKVKGVELPPLTRRELEKLRETIDKILSTEEVREPIFPSDIPKDLSLIAKAMLAVCRKYHRGYNNRADAGTIADEIAKDYPEIAKRYKSRARLVFATIFAAYNKRGGLVARDLLKMVIEDNRRKYWVES